MRDPFFEIVARQAGEHLALGAGEGFVEGARPRFRKLCLDDAGGAGADSSGEGNREVVEVGGGQDVVYEAHAVRFVRVDEASGQQEVGGVAEADEAMPEECGKELVELTVSAYLVRNGKSFEMPSKKLSILMRKARFSFLSK